MNCILRSVAVAAMLLIVLPACSSKPVRTDVDYVMVLPPFAERIELEQDEIFLMAAPIESPVPLFPPDVDPAALTGTVDVCIEVVIDEHGEVSSIQSLSVEPSCADISTYPGGSFLREVIRAVTQWSFIAAAICVSGPENDENCESPEAVVRPVAVKLSYIFSFTRDGRVEDESRGQGAMR